MPTPALTTPLPVGARPRSGRVLLIVNPVASRVSPRKQAEVLAALSGRHRVDAVSTQSVHEAAGLCREAAAGSHDLVVAFGGDGTVSAAARGMAGTGIPLACIPGGFTNVFSRTLGLPRDPVAAARHIAALPRDAAPRSVAMGAVNGRAYLFAAGAGFSAALMERLAAAESAKAGFGPPYAAWQVAGLLARAVAGGAPRFTIDAGGREAEAVVAIAQNSDPLTFFGSRALRVCPSARLGPPGISVAALRTARVRDVSRALTGVLSGNPERVLAHPRVEHWPAITEARLTSLDPDGLAIEADGDYLGRHRTVEWGMADENLLVLY